MAGSTQFTQILADILNRKVKSLSGIDPTLLGAAAITAFGAGKYSSIEAASTAIRKISSEFSPKLGNTVKYWHLYNNYIKEQDTALKYKLENITVD